MDAPAYTLLRPIAQEIPLLLDSPHSGTFYPEDFASCAAPSLLRTAEDTYVEELFNVGVELGGVLIAANYPRAYIDCNRCGDDIDVGMLDTPWPFAISPSEKTALGYGLIWRNLDDGGRIYDRALSVDEVRGRLDRVYFPYWKALRTEADRLHQDFGALYHLNCHSMPEKATFASSILRDTPHADVVLGDRDGVTCAPALVECISAGFRSAGLRVKINDPYKGVEIVRALGDPARNRHSVQIEINRALYLDERSREKLKNFSPLKQTINEVLRSVRELITR